MKRAFLYSQGAKRRGFVTPNTYFSEALAGGGGSDVAIASAKASKRLDTSKKDTLEAWSPPKRVAELVDEAQVAEEGAPAKLRKGLGVQVLGGRIYDSEKGKTCHYVAFFPVLLSPCLHGCRRKTIDFMASCKDTFESRRCTQVLVLP